MIDDVSLTNGPVALQAKQMTEIIRAGVQDGLPIVQGNRPINKVEPESLDSATPGLGGKIDVLA